MTGDNGEPYKPNYLSKLFRKIIIENGLPKISLHGLRHRFASIANDLGASLFDISKALEHSSASITEQIYTHMLDDIYRKAISCITQGFKK